MGKELIVCVIYNFSGCNNCCMVKMNCVVMFVGLLESDLFGYECGVFIGVSVQCIGCFELVDKSFLFFDEVGDMLLELQLKLLCVLQEQEFECFGSNKIIQMDVCLIVVINCDLKKMVVDCEFCSDFYYCLNVFLIYLLLLCECLEDILLLVKVFIFKIVCCLGCNIDSIFVEMLCILSNMEWLGNVCELENVIECVVLLICGNVLQLLLLDIVLLEFEMLFVVMVVVLEGEDEYQLIVCVLKEINGVVVGFKGVA